MITIKEANLNVLVNEKILQQTIKHFTKFVTITGIKINMHNQKLISHFPTKTYVLGTQKYRLNETVLLSKTNILTG